MFCERLSRQPGSSGAAPAKFESHLSGNTVPFTQVLASLNCCRRPSMACLWVGHLTKLAARLALYRKAVTRVISNCSAVCSGLRRHSSRDTSLTVMIKMLCRRRASLYSACNVQREIFSSAQLDIQ